MKNVYEIIAISFISVLLLEGALRVLEYTPYLSPKLKIESTPSHSIIPDEKFGFKLADGSFEITINDGLNYSSTHLNGERITKHSDFEIDSIRKSIEFYGCSFTYGTGVHDSLTFPFLVQNHFSNIDINNCAVPGYGTIQTLIKLEEKSINEMMPDYVILCYADFHNERDELNQSYQKRINLDYSKRNLHFKNEIIENWSFPYGKLENGVLKVKSKPFSNFINVDFLIQHSALWNRIQTIAEPEATKDVSLAIINTINKLCETNNTKFVIASLSDVNSIKDFCVSKNIKLWDISVPVHKSEYNLLPYDSHPSPKAHKKFAELMIKNLQKEKLNTTKPKAN